MKIISTYFVLAEIVFSSESKAPKTQPSDSRKVPFGFMLNSALDRHRHWIAKTIVFPSIPLKKVSQPRHRNVQISFLYFWLLCSFQQPLVHDPKTFTTISRNGAKNQYGLMKWIFAFSHVRIFAIFHEKMRKCENAKSRPNFCIFAFSNFRIFPPKSAIRPDFRIFAFWNFSMEKGKMTNWENEKIRPNFSHLPILFGFVIKIYDLFSCTFINLYSVSTVIILKKSFFTLIMNANCEVPPYTFINLWTVSLVIIL